MYLVRPIKTGREQTCLLIQSDSSWFKSIFGRRLSLVSQRQFFVCRRISIDVWPLNDKFSWGQLKNWVLHYQNTLKFDWFNLLILFLILFLILLAPQDSIFLLSSWKLVIQWPHIYAHRPAQHNLPLTHQTESAAEYRFESDWISKQVWLAGHYMVSYLCKLSMNFHLLLSMSLTALLWNTWLWVSFFFQECGTRRR